LDVANGAAVVGVPVVGFEAVGTGVDGELVILLSLILVGDSDGSPTGELVTGTTTTDDNIEVGFDVANGVAVVRVPVVGFVGEFVSALVGAFVGALVGTLVGTFV